MTEKRIAMTTGRKLCLVLGVLLACIYGFDIPRSQAADWPTYKGNSRGSSVSPEKLKPPRKVKDNRVVLQIHKHEQQLFDWHPKFNLNTPSFDSKNRPYIRSRKDDLHATEFVHTLRNGKWVVLDIIDHIKAAFPNFARTVRAAGWLQSRIVFDANDYAYTIIKIELTDKSQKNLLLYSRNYCKQWQVFKLPGSNFAIEHAANPNPVPEPPAIIVWTKRADHPSEWASYNVLRLIIPKTTKYGLELGRPIVVSRDSLYLSQHSGGAAFAVTNDGKTHLVWGEATDEKVPGVPTFAATYNRRTGVLGKKVLLAYAPPLNDGHNTPGICIDSGGFLHVITGAHGANFFYLKSKKPSDVYGGWTEPKPTLTTGWMGKDQKQSGRQTYLAFVCDREDTLHIAFRQWRRGVDHYHKDSYYGALSYQRKKKNGPWEEARPLVIPPMPRYSIYYHKFAIDRLGQLYLSYSYWNDTDKYKPLCIYHFRSLVFSGDDGNTWDLAVTRNFETGLKS